MPLHHLRAAKTPGYRTRCFRPPRKFAIYRSLHVPTAAPSFHPPLPAVYSFITTSGYTRCRNRDASRLRQRNRCSVMSPFDRATPAICAPSSWRLSLALHRERAEPGRGNIRGSVSGHLSLESPHVNVMSQAAGAVSTSHGYSPPWRVPFYRVPFPRSPSPLYTARG